MAKEIDLESQEQIDALKHFWDRYGTLITVGIALVAVVFFGMDWYRKYQDRQAAQASVLYGQMQLAADEDDLGKVERVLADMQQRYADTTYAEQAAFLAGSMLAADGQNDKAQKAVQWVLDNSANTGHKAVARLRLSALAVAQDDVDGAMQWLEAAFPASFEPLADDRRGDLLALQGKPDAAVAAYQKAYGQMDEKLRYRQLIGIKLTALGAAPDGDAETADGAETDAENTGAENTGAENTGAENTGAENTGAENTGAEKTDTETADAENSGTVQNITEGSTTGESSTGENAGTDSTENSTDGAEEQKPSAEQPSAGKPSADAGSEPAS